MKMLGVRRKNSISQATFYKYISKFGGIGVSDTRKLKVRHAQTLGLTAIPRRERIETFAARLSPRQQCLTAIPRLERIRPRAFCCGQQAMLSTPQTSDCACKAPAKPDSVDIP